VTRPEGQRPRGIVTRHSLAEEARVVPPPDETGTTPLAGVRVLVAEDNPTNQKVAVRMLQILGCFPVVVGDGARAVEAVARGGFDLVLMDVHMPVMDGLDATRSIRALPPGVAAVPVVALTASAVPAERRQCLDAGMDDFVSKPVKRDDLERALLAVLGRDAQRRAA
jgi:CheY-like chemotaxis protein